MLIVISPAKKLDYQSNSPQQAYTEPAYLEKSANLIKVMKNKTPAEIQSLMGISENLANLNHSRYLNWNKKNTKRNSKPAIYAFMGDVYTGLDAKSLTNHQIRFAQDHLRILSGLYGVLKPLDLIQPHRLEMGTKIKTESGETLYDFWGHAPTSDLNQQAKVLKTKHIVNLASNEYFKVINKTALTLEVLTPVFKDKKQDTYKVISFYAKKARGLMTKYIIENEITDPKGIKEFSLAGYKYQSKLSAKNEYVFTREQP
ncbi:MAG: peroxide stress protein YaaA [Gammaproteobacteria bacterium]